MPASRPFATLGEDAATVENDRIKLKAQVRTTAVAGYTVHEIAEPDGNDRPRVHQRLGTRCSRVAWTGPLLPDFEQTLGKYFPQYLANASSPRVGRRHLAIEGTDFVVHSNGHMRAFYGTAYVPSLLPPNFSVQDIQ